MSTYQVFVGDIETSQYANLYEQDLAAFPETFYNLTVTVNFQNLFSEHNYQQTQESNPTNADLVNVRLRMNTDKVNQLLGVGGIDSTGSVEPLTTGALGISGGKNNGSTNGAGSENDNVATRLLEIVAIHIFGHGRARAAIRNDSEYAASLKKIRDEVNILFNQDTANDFFNQYVNMNKINGIYGDVNDVNVNHIFNFEDIQLGYRINFVLTNTLDSLGADTTLITDGQAWPTNILLKFVHTA